MSSRSLPPSGAEQAKLSRRTNAVVRLRHPNLVRMTSLPGGAGLTPALGNTRQLADFTLPVGTFKRFDLEQIVRLLLDVLSGLSALHEVTVDGESFVHGDVSPRHIYVDEHGTARLVPLTSSHFRVGAKPAERAYAAPERLSGGACDVRTDVYSVGVMLWEALAGKRLLIERVDGTLERRQAPVVLSGRQLWARPLSVIAAKAIDPVPLKRYTSALELLHAIEMAAAQQLARVDTEAWQDEAPTPVFQPRLHLPFPRTTTPEPSVLNLLAPPPPKATEKPPRERDTLPAPPPGLRPRAPWAIAGVIATVLIAVPALLLFKSTWLREGFSHGAAGAAPAAAELRVPGTTAAARPAAAEATAPPAAAASPAAPSPSPLSPDDLAVETPAADGSSGSSVASAASATPHGSALPVHARPPRIGAKARPAAKPAAPARPKRVRAEDYGI